MHAEQYGTRVVGATSTSRPHSVISKAVTRVCFNASSLRSKVIARMWAASLLSLKNPEGNRRFHAHLFALTGAAFEGAVTVEKSRRQTCLTHPLERQESLFLTGVAALIVTTAFALAYRLVVGPSLSRFALLVLGVPVGACVWALRLRIASLALLALLVTLIARERYRWLCLHR